MSRWHIKDVLVLVVLSSYFPFFALKPLHKFTLIVYPNRTIICSKKNMHLIFSTSTYKCFLYGYDSNYTKKNCVVEKNCFASKVEVSIIITACTSVSSNDQLRLDGFKFQTSSCWDLFPTDIFIHLILTGYIILNYSYVTIIVSIIITN